MSYDVSLENRDGPVEVDRHEEGGTFVAGGTTQARLNVTYNYGPYHRKHLHHRGLWWLNGQVAANTVIPLTRAVAALGVQGCSDYWKATSGNAGYALSILLSWAVQHPTAVWSVR